MALELTRRHLGRELARWMSDELDGAVRVLTERPADPEAIHEARKSIKKIRAALKLLERPLGEAFQVENERLRQAGQDLGRVRDTDVVLSTFITLRRQSAAEIPAASARAVERGLRRLEAGGRRGALPAISTAVRLLQESRKRLPDLVRTAATGHRVLRGLSDGYRAARKSLEPMGVASGAAEFHLWRRRLKTHWYQLRLFEWEQPAARARLRGLGDLEKGLGECHDLAVFAERLLESAGRFGGTKATAPVLGAIDQRQFVLRARLLARGRRLFALKPKQFSSSVPRP